MNKEILNFNAPPRNWDEEVKVEELKDSAEDMKLVDKQPSFKKPKSSSGRQSCNLNLFFPYEKDFNINMDEYYVKKALSADYLLLAGNINNEVAKPGQRVFIDN